MPHAEGFPNLKPNAKGRPSRLNDPGFLQLVAECFAAGMSRQAMCDELDVGDKDTITRWRRDPRVKAKVQKLIEDRAIQISRKIDSVIEGKLSMAADMSIDELIKIRKEYGGSRVSSKELADDATVDQAVDALEQDPELADKLAALLNGGELAPSNE